MTSGIGCSSRLPAYVDTYGFHGRSPPGSRRPDRTSKRLVSTRMPEDPDPPKRQG
jgi:hypothetical protein